MARPDARPGPALPGPEPEERLWTDVDYVIALRELGLSRTHCAEDALLVFNPWLGPDQFVLCVLALAAVFSGLFFPLE